MQSYYENIAERSYAKKRMAHATDKSRQSDAIQVSFVYYATSYFNTLPLLVELLIVGSISRNEISKQNMGKS